MICQAVVMSDTVFGSLSLLSASTLVILRTKFIIAMGCTLWLANATTYIHDISISAFRGFRVIGVCVYSSFLLALMLIGALRWHNSRRGRIWWLLYMQGLAWVAIFTLAELPSVVLCMLDDKQFKLMCSSNHYSDGLDVLSH
ncbi:hypothetical protein BC827DRAFT_1249118 [Russula dissimulans]|nr:hypothetical protein BC827DRAFT_1249118 [Russula dissimulans]